MGKVLNNCMILKNIIGIQKIDPILTVANEGGNHEQGSHNKN